MIEHSKEIHESRRYMLQAYIRTYIGKIHDRQAIRIFQRGSIYLDKSMITSAINQTYERAHAQSSCRLHISRTCE